MSHKQFDQEEIQAAIAEYKHRRKSNPDTHIEYVKSLSNFRDIVTAACLAIDGQGQKHIHQFRMNNGRLKKFAFKLLELEKELISAKNFDELFNIVSSIRVFGLGAVVHYDTSLRIAHTRENLLPHKIYLIKETLKGAKNFGIETKGRKYITRDELPSVLADSDLECYELADLLCCYFSEGKWKDCLEFAL